MGKGVRYDIDRPLYVRLARLACTVLTIGLTESDVLFFQTFGTKWVVLNSLAAATELLEKRGSSYADRPRFVMFEEYVVLDA